MERTVLMHFSDQVGMPPSSSDLQLSAEDLQLSPALHSSHEELQPLPTLQSSQDLHSPGFQQSQRTLQPPPQQSPRGLQPSQGSLQPSHTSQLSLTHLSSSVPQTSPQSSSNPQESIPSLAQPPAPPKLPAEPNPKEIARPTTPVHVEMTRDQRIQARTLHSTGLRYSEIVAWFKEHGQGTLTYRQVSYACKTRATPQKRSGRPPRLTDTQVDQLIQFISSSPENRRMPYWKVAIHLGWEGLSENTIRSSLRRVGYTR